MLDGRSGANPVATAAIKFHHAVAKRIVERRREKENVQGVTVLSCRKTHSDRKTEDGSDGKQKWDASTALHETAQPNTSGKSAGGKLKCRGSNVGSLEGLWLPFVAAHI